VAITTIKPANLSMLPPCSAIWPKLDLYYSSAHAFNQTRLPQNLVQDQYFQSIDSVEDGIICYESSGCLRQGRSSLNGIGSLEIVPGAKTRCSIRDTQSQWEHS